MKHIWSTAFYVGVALLFVAACANERENNNDEVNVLDRQSVDHLEFPADEALQSITKKVDIPAGYELREIREGQQNEKIVTIFRFEKANGENAGLGGEHYSITVEKGSNQLLGFTWMDAQFANDKKLPTTARTTEVAKQFLETIEVGLFDRLDNQWIKPHDEKIRIAGEEVIVTGMKYKCYVEENDTFAWVIVGANEEVMTFEQEIKWVGGRVTEKWLHDDWLEKN